MIASGRGAGFASEQEGIAGTARIAGQSEISGPTNDIRVYFVLRHIVLTLKAPRKTASENVVCLCRLLNILADFSNQFLHTGKQCGPRSDCS